MLRQLSSYYYKEPAALFLVRVAQGLVHMGKGLLGLAPHHTDGQLLSGVVALVQLAHPLIHLISLAVVHLDLSGALDTWMLHIQVLVTMSCTFVHYS